MVDFRLHLEEPESNRLWLSAIFMGMSYMLGGIVPMIPYFAIENVTHALFVSISITVVELILFGYAKALVTGLKGRSAVISSIQTLIVGAAAAATSYAIVFGVNQGLSGGQGVA